MKKPRILLFDIETSPNLAYVWGKWEQNVISFKKEWEMLSFAYKWLGEREVYCVTRQDHKDEKDLIKPLWELLDEADIVIAHNGDSFDNKKVRAKFVEHGLKPPSIYKTIDTKKIAKANFQFNSNSLNDLGTTLKLGNKIQTGGFDLWLKCMAGDKKAWAQMAKYNKQDVVLLEKVYNKLKVWDPRHINLAAYTAEKSNCPICHSPNIVNRGYSCTRTMQRPKRVCKDCGHWHLGAGRKI
jgi:DNA polymerase elongation subunit (family B)